MNSLLVVFIVVYCTTITLVLLMPKRRINSVMRRVDKDFDLEFTTINSKYVYYKFLIFWAGVTGGIITLIIKLLFY
ncbi:hypothetical protein [Segetibacter aerophilus]|uniref:hypothetical protein n=1 Tax=Segetibacter aerophilus TaxID=670293 RepID=UPI0011BFC86A|nr:hypothetical protein [Segetibacter aerophilus]